MASPKLTQARVLALCQALFTSALSVDLTLTGLVGYTLASDKALATLPFALITVASAVFSYAASFVIERLGRRIAFGIGGLACMAGGLVSVWAISRQDFVLFCVGTALVGVFQAFAAFYRLAAADVVPVAEKPRAISIVLTGGVAAAVCGPAIAAWSRDMLLPLPFAGAYAVVAAFGAATVLLLAFAYRDAPSAAAQQAGSELPARPLSEVMRQPIFRAALANNAIGNAVMMFVMTATPIAAVACNHSIGEGAQIIEWHLVGMYAPSFFSAWLIQRFGLARMTSAGIVLCALASMTALASGSLVAFYTALLLLGVGWNFMFVGGSAMLVASYRPAERARTQAVVQFGTALVSALAGLAAGQVLNHWGWHAVNLAVFPVLAIALYFTLDWWQHTRRAARLAPV
jgi:MFS family permease